jgi:hypothetical protein
MGRRPGTRAERPGVAAAVHVPLTPPGAVVERGKQTALVPPAARREYGGASTHAVSPGASNRPPARSHLLLFREMSEAVAPGLMGDRGSARPVGRS